MEVEDKPLVQNENPPVPSAESSSNNTSNNTTSNGNPNQLTKKKPKIKKKKNQTGSSPSSNSNGDNNNQSKSKKRGGEESANSTTKVKLENASQTRSSQKDEGEDYEDPFEDEFEDEIYDDWVEEEEVMEDEGGKIVKEEEIQNDEEENTENIKVWKPGQQLADEEVLEYDNAAYEMLHQMRVEWPCLSFAVFPDQLGMQRTKYPFTTYLVTGTQADQVHNNQLVVVKAASLHKTRNDHESDAEDDIDDTEDDPILEFRTIRHPGSVNRVKIMPQAPHIVASWSEDSNVYLWDLNEHVFALDKPGQIPGKDPKSSQTPWLKKIPHSTEGFAMDWSPVKPGRLVTGDGKKLIYLTEPVSGSASAWVTGNKAFTGHTSSVEDLQWSPSEQDVFASCSADKTIKVWDVRMKKGAALSFKAANCDVNVISWNKKVNHLLLSGADDGSFSVWDLRDLKNNGDCDPIGRFAWHTDQITSVEWDPNDESSLAVASADNQVTLWDLSVEKDTEEGADEEGEDEFPPQLLFYHHQKDVKEIHFHPQIPGLLISTGEDGINFFKPNITPEEGEEESDQGEEDGEDDE